MSDIYTCPTCGTICDVCDCPPLIPPERLILTDLIAEIREFVSPGFNDGSHFIILEHLDKAEDRLRDLDDEE